MGDTQKYKPIFTSGLLPFIRERRQVASLVAQTLKNLPAVQEMQVWSLGLETPLEKGMAIHSSILAWRIPWTEEPGRLQSMWLQRVGHNWATNTFTFQKIGTCEKRTTKGSKKKKKKAALMSSEQKRQQQTLGNSPVLVIRPYIPESRKAPISQMEKEQLRLSGNTKYSFWVSVSSVSCYNKPTLTSPTTQGANYSPDAGERSSKTSLLPWEVQADRGTRAPQAILPAIGLHQADDTVSNVCQEQQKVFSLLEFFLFLPPLCL